MTFILNVGQKFQINLNMSPNKTTMIFVIYKFKTIYEEVNHRTNELSLSILK